MGIYGSLSPKWRIPFDNQTWLGNPHTSVGYRWKIIELTGAFSSTPCLIPGIHRGERQLNRAPNFQ